MLEKDGKNINLSWLNKFFEILRRDQLIMVITNTSLLYPLIFVYKN